MAIGSYGQTSLHLAAEVGYDRVVQLLIEAGASTSAVYCWRPKLDKTLVVCIILFIGFSVVLFGMSSSAAAAVVVCTLGGLTGFGSRAMKKGRRFVIRMLVKGGPPVYQL